MPISALIHVRIHIGNVKAEEYSEMFHLFASIEPTQWRRGREFASHAGDQGSVPGRYRHKSLKHARQQW